MLDINGSFQSVKNLMAAYKIAVDQGLNEVDREDIRSILRSAMSRFKKAIENVELLIRLEDGHEIKIRDIYFEGGDLMTSGFMTRPQSIPLTEIISITEYVKVQLNLYLLERDGSGLDCDETVSCVVAAENLAQAYELSVRAIGWRMLIEDMVAARLIGVAVDGIEEGEVIRSCVGG